MITHIKFVSVAPRDQDAALRFWTEKVGFRVVTDQPMGEQRWIELAVGHSDTRLVLFTPEGEEGRAGRMFNASFACDNVEHTYEQMKARGVEFTAPPEKRPWGTYATFADPEGNGYVLTSR